jgi:hypothetical protein
MVMARSQSQNQREEMPPNVVANCVFYVEEYVRGAVAQLDPDERLGLFNQIETALRAIKAETDDPGTAAAERWSEA